MHTIELSYFDPMPMEINGIEPPKLHYTGALT